MRRRVLQVFLLVMALILPAASRIGVAAAGPVTAEAPTAGAATETATGAGAGTESDLRAVDRALGLLKDDKARAELIGGLEDLRAGLARRTAAPAPQPDDRQGLIGALATGISIAGATIAQGGGVASGNQFAYAFTEFRDRLAEGMRSGALNGFLLRALPGWALALAAALAVGRIPSLRPRTPSSATGPSRASLGITI